MPAFTVVLRGARALMGAPVRSVALLGAALRRALRAAPRAEVCVRVVAMVVSRGVCGVWSQLGSWPCAEVWGREEREERWAHEKSCILLIFLILRVLTNHKPSFFCKVAGTPKP